MHPSLRVLGLAHAVHPIGREVAPLAGSYAVCLHRLSDHRVQTRGLEPILAELVADWIRGELPAIDSVRAVLAAHGREPDAAFVERMSALVSDLVEHGAILGSR